MALAHPGAGWRPSVAEVTDLMATAEALAEVARAAILPWFRAETLPVDDKAQTAEHNQGQGGFDPVTEADRAAEQAMRALLAVRRPDDGILGEEYGAQVGRTGLTWVLDPIDGTRGFMAGTPTWGVLVAVSDDTGPILGLIDQPYIGERFRGGPGIADMIGPHGYRALRCRAARPLAQAIVLTTFPEIGTPADHAAFARVAQAARLVRYGTDCYGYALVATGQVDLVIEAGLQPYDVHAPIAVIRAAGGLVTDWQGGPAHYGGQVLAAANASVHAAALALLNG